MTNSRGNSETAHVSFAGLADAGLRTLAGGQFSIEVAGHLAIETGAAPPLVVENTRTVREVFAVVSEPPTGGPVTVMCGHGERAMSGASVLERAGRHDVSVLLGGPSDWTAAHRVDLETSLEPGS